MEIPEMTVRIVEAEEREFWEKVFLEMMFIEKRAGFTSWDCEVGARNADEALEEWQRRWKRV